jgi:3-oxoacyl-[acyl-carrier protein] reductase
LALKVQEKFGKIDVLVLNHGVVTHSGNQLEITEELYDQCFNVNLKSSFFMIKTFLPLLKKGTQANVIVTSTNLVSHPVP